MIVLTCHIASTNFAVCDFFRLAVTDWRLRFLALSNASLNILHFLPVPQWFSAQKTSCSLLWEIIENQLCVQRWRPTEPYPAGGFCSPCNSNAVQPVLHERQICVGKSTQGNNRNDDLRWGFRGTGWCVPGEWQHLSIWKVEFFTCVRPFAEHSKTCAHLTTFKLASPWTAAEK